MVVLKQFFPSGIFANIESNFLILNSSPPEPEVISHQWVSKYSQSIDRWHTPYRIKIGYLPAFEDTLRFGYSCISRTLYAQSTCSEYELSPRNGNGLRHNLDVSRLNMKKLSDE